MIIVWVALRGLVAQRLSLVLLVIAIAIGVGFQIPNTANLAGSSATLLEEGLTWGFGDVRVEPRGKPRFRAAPMRDAISRVVPSSTAVPVVALAGGIAGASQPGRFFGAAVLAVDFATAPVRISDGRAPVPNETGVVLGSAIARRLKTRVGDDIELRVVLDDDDIGAYTMKVLGIASNSAAYETVFVDRALIAVELSDPDTASVILVHLDNHDDAPAAAQAIAAAVPDVRAVDWATDDPFLPTMLRANRVIERVSYGMVIAAISVPLLALLYIRVLRKRREIAVLRALGFTRGEVFGIHVLQSLMIGVVGAALGAAIGRVAIAIFDRYPIFTWETMVVRPLATTDTFAMPMIAAVATAVLAGAVAAWRAASTDPARMLQRLD
jgi:lipoprotein-releasing system permease protein